VVWVRRLSPGQRLEIRSSEPSVAVDLPTWCRLTGHQLIAEQLAEDNARRYLVRRKAGCHPLIHTKVEVAITGGLDEYRNIPGAVEVHFIHLANFSFRAAFNLASLHVMIGRHRQQKASISDDERQLIDNRHQVREHSWNIF
jgi:hypothetical protein